MSYWKSKLDNYDKEREEKEKKEHLQWLLKEDRFIEKTISWPPKARLLIPHIEAIKCIAEAPNENDRSC